MTCTSWRAGSALSEMRLDTAEDVTQAVARYLELIKLAALVQRIRWSAIGFGGLGVVLGFVLSYWVASRVTRPVEQLADVARTVADGNWDIRRESVRASGEYRVQWASSPIHRERSFAELAAWVRANGR